MRQELSGSVRNRLTLVVMAILMGLAGCSHLPPRPVSRVEKPPAPPPRPAPEVREQAAPLPLALEPQRFNRIDQVAKHEVAAGHIPGAVVLVGHNGKIVYRQAFGSRCLAPTCQPMTTDTVFDIASLTKVVATTNAVMQLVDKGCLRLDAPAATYWPEFAANGKAGITIRQLMTHTSGLRPEVNPRVRWQGYEGALLAIAADYPVNPPGSTFRYSDCNFIVLGEIVHRVSNRPLDVYCAQEVFGPLGMRDTSFRPSAAQQSRIAPCDVQNGRLRCGQVQDPTSYCMGGVAGHAGVFSTVDDLAILCQMILDGGKRGGKQILSSAAVATMLKPNPVPASSTVRALGWDIRSPFSRIFNASFPNGSFGHTGYTGTSIWMDPRSKTFIIVLTNRLHPNGHGDVKPLRAQTAAAVAAALPLGRPAGLAALSRADRDLARIGHGQSDSPDLVKPGIDVLGEQKFSPLVGKKIGLITNHTGIDTAGRTTISRLLNAPGVKVAVLFSPEHGLYGNRDEKIASGRDSRTGLTVYSLYGKVLKPTPQMLHGLDALVYDVQDVGTRFYTYITTMAYAMEAAAAAGLDFYVLDRPDPLNATAVQGPVLDPDLKSFIGYCPMPVRYGMTPGELALLMNRECGLGARLHVVRVEGYRRDAWFDETGLRWVDPSPNIRNLTQAILYPGVAIVESANVSVGRGTDKPFEIIGAPWISGTQLARYLNQRQIPGVAFEAVTFVPNSDRCCRQRCEGVKIRLMDRAVFDAPALGVELASALSRLYPGKFDLGNTLGMIGSREVVRAIKQGEDPREIKRRWTPGLERFCRLRAKYLIY